MKKPILLALTLACLAASHAAIRVGTAGSGPWTFTNFPTVAEGWSTLSITGGGGTYTTAAGLDAAVMANTFGTLVSQTLGTSGTQPPSENIVARWNSGGLYVQTRPSGNAYLILAAALQNDTGGNVSNLFVSYDWDQKNSNPVAEDVPGHRVFFNVGDVPGNWRLVPELSTFTVNSTAQNLIAMLPLGTWPTNRVLYIIWVDDNGPGGIVNPMEGAYTIDNVFFSPNSPPSNDVTIMAPANGAVFPQGAPITISAIARMQMPIQ